MSWRQPARNKELTTEAQRHRENQRSFESTEDTEGTEKAVTGQKPEAQWLPCGLCPLCDLRCFLRVSPRLCVSVVKT